MRAFLGIWLLTLALQPVVAQQIWDIWQTKWDRTKILTYQKVQPPIEFGSPSTIGTADIVVDDEATFQSIWGFGGSLTDSAALTLDNLKTANSASYWKLINYLFDPTDGANAAGLNYVRVPLGASDFSDNTYSFDDTSGDTSFNNFNINRAPSYLFSVLQDIKSVNNILRIHIVPWSPPAWMKDSGSMKGGSMKTQYNTQYATYLLKAVQGFNSKGLKPYAISIQNEPQNSNPTYPTCKMTPSQEGTIGRALRGLLNSNGLSSVKVIGYEHNWDDAGAYPVTLMTSFSDAFAGVAFHCYAGSVSNQDAFHTKFPQKEIYFSECAGTIGSDWWEDIKWYMDNIFIGSVNHNSHSGLMWNIALQPNGEPKLPGTSSCGGGGCRPIVSVPTGSSGSWSLNQEFYAMAQASKAIIPRDVGGAFGKRIGVSIGGTKSWALVVSAFVTERVNAADWNRYSLVVLNWDDSEGGGWNPLPVLTTIEFRDAQATYTFPVGVTTLWWYAAAPGFNGTTASTEPMHDEIFAESGGKQERLGLFKKDN